MASSFLVHDISYIVWLYFLYVNNITEDTYKTEHCQKLVHFTLTSDKILIL
jgi:hypothetical protein